MVNKYGSLKSSQKLGCAIFMDMDAKMIFAKRLKELRVLKGYTQGYLSEISNVHEKAIARYEAGTTAPTADNIVKLAQALEVCTDYLLISHAQKEGVPKIKDPALYERYFELETLNDEERKAALIVIEALITQHRFQELAESRKTG